MKYQISLLFPALMYKQHTHMVYGKFHILTYLVLDQNTNDNACPAHRWKLPGNYPVFVVVMVIYHYVERIWRILFTPVFLYNIYVHEKTLSR